MNSYTSFKAVRDIPSDILASEDVYGVSPMVKPTGEASNRSGTWLGNKLGVQAAKTVIGPPDWHGHATNEFITIPTTSTE